MNKTRLEEWFFPGEPRAAPLYRREIERYLPGKGKILDLGCGNNAFLSCYRTDDRQVWGVDFHKHPNLKDQRWFRLLSEDGRIPFADRTFDVVTSCWVLEHVESPKEFLDEVARVLRPGGAFVSLSINGRHYVTWLARLLRWLPHQLTQKLVFRLYKRPFHDTFRTWYRLNTQRQIRRAADGPGMEVGAIQRIASADYFSFFRPCSYAATLLDWTLEKMWPGTGRIFFVVTLRSRAGEGTARAA